MKKKIILLIFAVVIISLGFVPVYQQKTTQINASFLRIYTQLATPEKWEKWNPELKEAFAKDSAKIVIQKAPGTFSINYKQIAFKVALAGNTIDVNESKFGRTLNYALTTIPDQSLKQSSIIVSRNISLFKWATSYLSAANWVEESGINAFKKFMETDSLYYGVKIIKTRVPQSNLIVIRKTVAVKQRFEAAAAMQKRLIDYVAKYKFKQTAPVIAQFLPKGKDSAQVNIGYFIDREATSKGEVTFMRMPIGGPLYAVKYIGKFNKREFLYNGLDAYFADHRYQSAILPFETYLDNKLPKSNTDVVNIQVNYTAYF